MPESEHLSGTGPRPRRILVAEDNLVNQRVTVKMLERLGAECTVAANGRLAIEAAVRDCYDLILMDCQMPEMDGFEATRELRRAGILTPIVALTAGAIPGEREKCLEAGMNEFLTKPVDFKLLAELVQFRWD